MADQSPWGRTLTLGAANVPSNLLTLMIAADSQCPRVVGALMIQPDVDANTARFFWGNPGTLSPTDRGAEFFAGQPFGISSVLNNISLQKLEIMSDEDGQTVNVTTVTW